MSSLLGNSTDGSSYDEGQWEVVYFLAAYGGLFYLITFSTFPVLMYFLNKNDTWTPLNVKQRGLTQLGAAAGCLWFLHNMLVPQLPLDDRDEVLPPHSGSCWLGEFWRTVSVCIYSNAVLVKQYKSYVRYVSRDGRLPTYVYMLLLSIPYVIVVALPFWNRYDTDTDECSNPQSSEYLLFSWTAVVLLVSIFLLNTLRDTCMFYPNFKGSLAEVTGLGVIMVVKALELWFSCDGEMCPSHFTKVSMMTFTLITVPNTVYWIALGEVMWKVVTGDVEYCRNLERLCSPTSHLILANTEVVEEYDDLCNDDEDAEQHIPIPRMRPNYDKGSTGEFFETDRLARLIDSGGLDAVRSFVLATNLDLVHILDREGLAPLHRAVQGGYADLVEFLIEINCDPNLPSRDGDRAVHFAARQGNTTILAILHEANADVNAISHRGMTPLHYAVLAASMPAINLLLDRGALVNIPGMEVVSNKGNWEKVHVADAGRIKNYWKQPLTVAVELGLVEAVAAMALPVVINTPCTHGVTQLMIAVVLGHKAVAEVLLKSGIDIWRISNRDKRNVLHYNAMQGGTQMFTLLKEWFLNTEPPNSPPQSPKKSIPSTPKVGLPRSASPTCPSLSPLSGAPEGSGRSSFPSEKTSSMFAADSLSTDPIDLEGKHEEPLLWTNGPADPKQLLAIFLSMPDCMGRTPLHYAVLKTNHDLVSMLLAEGANAKARDLQRPERGCLGATPSEYIQQLQAAKHNTPGERAEYYKVWLALQPRAVSRSLDK